MAFSSIATLKTLDLSKSLVAMAQYGLAFLSFESHSSLLNWLARYLFALLGIMLSLGSPRSKTRPAGKDIPALRSTAPVLSSSLPTSPARAAGLGGAIQSLTRSKCIHVESLQCLALVVLHHRMAPMAIPSQASLKTNPSFTIFFFV